MMEPRIVSKENLYEAIDVEGSLITPNKDEGRIRSEGNSKPKSLKDILPVLVAVWGKMSSEIRSAYKLFRELLDDKMKVTLEPFVDAVDAEDFPDYYEVIKEPMNLFRISEKFHCMEYESITEVVADIRQIIENCFRYNGFDAFISKHAQKLEVILEQKLNLLSREMRSKTTIAATNKVKNKEYLNSLLFIPGRRSLNQKHRNGETSMIAMQMNLQKELEGKEKKRLKEKEKKEINSALEEECERWTKEVLNSDYLAEMKCSWEIPSIGIFLCILKDFLNLQDFSYSEFELGMLFPRESSLVARIFTSLLVTSFQRKKLNSKDPMKYSVWSEKVKSRIVSWYKIANTHGQEYSAALYGFDADLFQVLGFVNPFQDSEFHELPLKSRVWILKALCEVALEQDSLLRDYFGELEVIDRQDVCLGFDSEGFSYHYISHFGATDVRIYKQKIIMNPATPKPRDQPIMMEKDQPNSVVEASKNSINEESKIKSNQESGDADKKSDGSNILVRTSKRIRTKRSLSPPVAQGTPAKKEKKANKIKFKDFFVIADDIPSLKALHDRFDSVKKEKGSRKQAEKELQQSLDALYVELKKREANFIKSNLKSRMKIMVECKEWVKAVKSAEDEKKQMEGWDSENDEEDDEEVDELKDNNLLEATSISDKNTPSEFVTSSSSDKLSSCQSLPPNDALTLTKEGRKLRSRRFDVKELFAEPTQPQSKRSKLENTKQDVRTQISVNNGCTKEDHDFDPCDSDESDRASKQNSKRRRTAQNMRRKQARYDEISERDILMLRKKRLEKIKQDLREGKILTAEEQRNLMHLGLSSREIEELKKLQKTNPGLKSLFTKHEVEGKRNMDDVKKEAKDMTFDNDIEKSFSSYDGLKALADVASLAKQTTPVSSPDKYKKGQSSTDEVASKRIENTVAKNAKKTDGTNLVLVGKDKNRSGTDRNSVVYVIDGKGITSSSYIGNSTQIAKLKTTEMSSIQIGTMKNIVIEGKVPKAANDGERKERIVVTPNHSVSSSPAVAAENCGVQNVPLILQRKRPNILRKTTTNTPIETPLDSIDSTEKNSTARKEHDNGAKTAHTVSRVGASNVYEDKPAIASSMRSNNTQVSRRLVVAQSGPVSAVNYAKIPRVQMYGGNQVHINGRTINQVDNLVKPSLPVVSQQSQKQSSDVSTERSVVTGNIHSIQTKSSLGQLILVTQSSPVIGQSAVPLILATNSHLVQGKGHDKTQPVLLLAQKQPVIQQGSFQGKQPQQQCVVLKQQGDTCLLTYEQQPKQFGSKVSSVTGHAVSEMEQTTSSICPVTTLKSKLHAAALKKKLSGKNKPDILQSVHQPVASSIKAPIGFPGKLPHQSVQSLQLSGLKTRTLTEACSQRKAISIVKTQPKIAPKTVHIIKSSILNGTHPAKIVCTSGQVVGNDAESNSVPIACSDVTPMSSFSGTCSPGYLGKDVKISKAKEVGVADKLHSVEGSKNVQIIRKVNAPVNATDADKAVFYTSWSNAYVPKKSQLPSSNKKPAITGVGISTASPSTKPALVESQRSVDSPPQVTSQILIVPASFPTHQRTVSLPAQIVQLPAQIPSKQEVSGAGESNRGIATAAQLVIVPQTRAPKQIRPAVDSTTAVKALKSLEQAMKPASTVSSLVSLETTTLQDNAEHVHLDLGDISVNTLEKSDASVQLASNSICKQVGTDTSNLLLSLNQDVVASSAVVKDKSSVTYSTLFPIPCAEVKSSVSETVTVKEEDINL